MHHKWMVFFSMLVLFSLLIVPVGTAQAQVISPDCPPYEDSLLREKEFLRSLPLECINFYREATRPLHSGATGQDVQPMATGGPDGFGYTYDDTVPYNWISATTNSGLTGYSEFTGPIDIGFSFPFYGVSQSQLYFSTNGAITFGSGSGDPAGSLLSETVPNNLIAPFSDWLYYVGSPYNNGAVYYVQGGSAPNRYFVVEWRDVELDYGSSTVPFTFEAILYESGDILFQYQSLPDYDYFSPAIGIENSIGSEGLAYYDYRYWYSGVPRAIRFSYPTTSTARLLVSPAVQAGAFTTINGHKDFTITVTNTGSIGTDTYDLAISSLWQTNLYASNGVTPLTDRDGDNLIDTNSLPQGQSITLIARVATPNGAQIGDENRATVTFTSSLNPSKTKTIELFTSIPANFANVFQDEANGAMSFMTIDSHGESIAKATADNHFGYETAVSKMPNDNYVYVWNKGYNNGNRWVDDIEYAILAPTGNLILPATKLTNNNGAPMYISDRFPAVAVAPDGTIGVVWRRYLSDSFTGTYNYNVYFATFNSAGSLLTGPTNITNKPLVDVNDPRIESPTIAATDDNRFVISWPESLPPISPYYRDYIWYAVRNTAGANVFSPHQITTDYVSSQFPVLNPLIDGKAILTWVEDYNPQYAIINSDGSTLGLPWQDLELGSAVSQIDAVQLPNGKVAIAWPAYGGVEFAILNSYYLIENSSFGAMTPGTWGDALSVTTDADSHVIMTWDMQSNHNHLYYALGDSTGTFLTAPMPYKTSNDYIEISGNGQGNAPYAAEPDTAPPTVTSIQRVSAATTSAATLSFTVTFSEPVSGVASGDFNLSAAGQITGANIKQVSGSSSVYTVTVNTGSGNGTLGLTVPMGATIRDLAGNLIGGLPFTGGEIYTIQKTAATWQYVGTAGFSSGGANFPSLVFNGSTPYLAFGDVANDGKASVVKFNGPSWVNVGPAGFSDGLAFYTSLAIDNGTPYVAFSDMAHGEKLSVMKFDGVNWVNVGAAGFSNGRAWTISLAFDGGTPYVAFGDVDLGRRVSVMKFNGTNWVNVGPAGISQSSADSISLVFNNGTPYVAYSHPSNNGRPSVIKFDGTSWVNVGPANFSAGQANGVSLAFEDSTPYVVFQDAPNGYKASVMRFDGTGWVNVGAAGFSGGAVSDTSIAIHNGTPYVAFADESDGWKTSVMKFDGTGWVNVGAAGFSSGETAYASFTIHNGIPYVAFADGAQSWKASVMKFSAVNVGDPMCSIQGNTGIAGVTLSYTDGTPQSVLSDSNGHYSITVPAGWSGAVTPSKANYTFTPANRAYGSIQADQMGQDYKASNGADTTGVFRPSNGLLYLKNRNVTGFADVEINYGIGGDYPVVGDWDGDGDVTIGIYRNGQFYLRNSNTIGFADKVFAFGQPGDQPVAGDWNGDGIDTIGVYRNGTFFLRNSNNAGAPQMIFGLGVPGDIGITGDWNGDGKDSTGVFRPSNGLLYLKHKNETGFADIEINYGIGGDHPVTGDWNNDGIDTIGVYRNGQFFLRNSNTIGFADIVFALGVPGDHPIAGNWDASE